ncbi:MAG: hypothetical protein NTV86_15480 [Planctomycetota bacterium]|nr:hypothetical protein [Planctomycetota bacterium]
MDNNLFTPFLRGIAAAWWAMFGLVVAVGIGAFMGSVAASGTLFVWTAPLGLLFSILGYGVFLLCGSIFGAVGRSFCLAGVVWLLLLGAVARWYFSVRKAGAFFAVVALTMVEVTMGLAAGFTWAVWARMAVAGVLIAGAYAGVRLYPIWLDRKDQEASRREKALRRAESREAQSR